MKQRIKQVIIKGINSLNLSSEKWGTPKGTITAVDWCNKNGASFETIYGSKEINQEEPITLDGKVHRLFHAEYKRTQGPSFVAEINEGRVWGKSGAVITPDDLLVNDVSREFGAYGGVFGRKHSIFQQLRLANTRYIEGTVAVLASAGANNFHHWLYDNLPRLHLIQEAGLVGKIDYYILDYTALPFQKETLLKAGIPEEKILNCHANRQFHIKAKTLIVPSLPSRLGVVSDWTVEYLRDIFTLETMPEKLTKKIYISRAKAPSRKIVNENELIAFLIQEGFTEYFAEDHSVAETAALFGGAEFIVGVHGSGLSNLAFAGKGVKVIDIVAPRHLDPYYWVLTAFREGKYAYITGEGNVDNNEADLVKEKIDYDIKINMDLFKQLFQQLKNTN